MLSMELFVAGGALIVLTLFIIFLGISFFCGVLIAERNHQIIIKSCDQMKLLIDGLRSQVEALETRNQNLEIQLEAALSEIETLKARLREQGDDDDQTTDS
ncbi:MAG: hypothetical protein AAF485_05740 [Chloroflexota bacterium]